MEMKDFARCEETSSRCSEIIDMPTPCVCVCLLANYRVAKVFAITSHLILPIQSWRTPLLSLYTHSASVYAPLGFLHPSTHPTHLFPHS